MAVAVGDAAMDRVFEGVVEEKTKGEAGDQNEQGGEIPGARWTGIRCKIIF